MSDLPGFGGSSADGEDPLVDQLRIQNAILLELVHAVHERNEIELEGHREGYRRRSQAKRIEDNMIDLEEQVDPEVVDRAQRRER